MQNFNNILVARVHVITLTYKVSVRNRFFFKYTMNKAVGFFIQYMFQPVVNYAKQYDIVCLQINVELYCTQSLTDRYDNFFFSISVNNFLFLPYACDVIVSQVIFLDIFFPTGPFCQCCCLPIISFYLCFKLLLAFSEGQYKNITSNVPTAVDICFCVLELQACLCTWHCVCPCMKCFLAETGEICRHCHSFISPTFSGIYAHG